MYCWPPVVLVLLSYVGCCSFMWHKSGTVTFLLQLGTPDIVIVPRNDRSGLVRLWLVGLLVVLKPCASEEQCEHPCGVKRIRTSRIPPPIPPRCHSESATSGTGG